MYKVIMVPTDGSGFDREAIRVALRTAERNDAKVRLVRVLATGSFFGPTPKAEATGVEADLTCSERDRAMRELYALAAECRATSRRTSASIYTLDRSTMCSKGMPDATTSI